MDHHCSSQCGSSGSHHCRWYHHGPFLAATRPPSGLSKGSLGCHTAPGSNATCRHAVRPHLGHHRCRFEDCVSSGQIVKGGRCGRHFFPHLSASNQLATDLTLLQQQIKTFELELSEPEPQSRTEIGGVFVYILAKISQFVLKTQTPQWARNVQERSGASLSATLYFPAPQIADGAVPVICHLFVMVVHAFGLEHLHAVGPFIHRVVNESVWLHDYTWSYAYELLLIYLKALDERRMGISMANIWDSGSQDTFAKNAAKSAVQRWGPDFAFFRTHGGIPGNKQSAASTSAAAANNAGATTNTKWNGRFTKDAKPCLTFNNGRSEHPRSCLLADGTCKFNHVCDHFLDDGKKCGSAAHGRHACDNPNKRLPQQ